MTSPQSVPPVAPARLEGDATDHASQVADPATDARQSEALAPLAAQEPAAAVSGPLFSPKEHQPVQDGLTAADLAHRTPIVVADQLTSDIGRVGHGRQMVGSTREDGTIEDLVTRRRKGVCGLEGRGGIINADGNVGSDRKFPFWNTQIFEKFFSKPIREFMIKLFN